MFQSFLVLIGDFREIDFAGNSTTFFTVLNLTGDVITLVLEKVGAQVTHTVGGSFAEIGMDNVSRLMASRILKLAPVPDSEQAIPDIRNTRLTIIVAT